MLNIIVCIKQVSDPEAPISTFEIGEDNQIKQKGVPPVINPFDENALEAALRIKDVHESNIKVISLGKSLAKPILRKALAVGADELILLEDNLFADLDCYATAYALAAAIKHIGPFDIILTGRQAADTDAGVTGPGIAEILGIPGITIARKVEVKDNTLRTERLLSDGYEVIENPLPALVTASNELGELRSAALKDLMEAQKSPIKTMTAQELGIEAALNKRATLLKLFIPQSSVTCEFILGETEQEAGANLAEKLKQAQLI